MQKKWSLDSLYSSFDAPEFINDLVRLESTIESTVEHTLNFQTVSDLEQYFKYSEEIRKLTVKLFGFSNLTFSANTNHQEALKAKNKIQILLSKLTPATTRAVQFTSKIENIDRFIESSEVLSQVAYKIYEMKQMASHMLSEKEEILASRLSITGSTAFTTLQSKLTSSLTAKLNHGGNCKELPIASIRNLASDKSASLRKAAYEGEIEAYSKIDEAIAMAINSIKGEVITMAHIRGYESPLHMTLETSRMSEKTLTAMLDAIRESIPQFQDYLQTKGKLLGHTHGLPFYDLFAPIGSVSKHFTYEEGCDFVLSNFETFSESLTHTAKMAMENGWIDVVPADGKVNGAFCASLHPLGEFRILLNYTGTLGNVTTLAHELGHGYHAVCINGENILNTDYPMPLAETASTFCETIVNNAAMKIATAEEELTILENSLQDSTQVICDIYSRYLFETKLFETRLDHPLSVRELKEIMTDAQKVAYGKGLDHNTLHPYMWLIKPHYYSAGLNFYNFPYAFGLLFAKGLYAKYLEEPSFFKSKYDALLAASGKMSIVDVCKTMAIDVESSDFWRASLQIIEKDIARFKALAQEAL